MVGRAAAMGALTSVAYTAAAVTKASDFVLHGKANSGDLHEMAHNVIDHTANVAQEWWKNPKALSKLGYFAVAGLPATNFFLGEAAAGWIEGTIMRWIQAAENISEPRLAAIGIGAGVAAALAIETVCGVPVAIRNKIRRKARAANGEQVPPITGRQIRAASATAVVYGGAAGIDEYDLEPRHAAGPILGYGLFSLIYSAALTVNNAAIEIVKSGAGAGAMVGILATMAMIGKTHAINGKRTILDRGKDSLVRATAGLDPDMLPDEAPIPATE
ncbi:MAG TPA: hypothetical protein VLF69_02940 [Candidatus Saccharimonadales bacterium]|nr:hypothetical protein [Candidatus Saccharimonadales bacterium]